MEREPQENDARVLKMVTRAAFRATWVKDAAGTDAAKKQARDAVTVGRTYKPGDIVLRKGATLSDSYLQQLRKNGLLQSGTYTLVVPLALIILLGVVFLGVYIRAFARLVYDSSQKLTLLAFLLVAPVWAATAFSVGEQQYLVALIAVPAACMVIAGLLGGLIAVPAAVLTALAASFPADHQFAIFILTLGSALAGMIMVTFIWPARNTVLAALSLIMINLLLLTVVPSIIPSSGYSILFLWSDMGARALWATAGGLGAIFFAVGAIYMLARPFGIVTHYRLMELSNPNEPLLRRMMLEAPGSYHSSVMVANMAEAAADAIGADALLTRVAALYHDIGKLKRPTFFVENQAPLGIENVHEKLTPKMSYLILTNHVRDGLEQARENQLPEEVINIIGQHHGTTLAAYFYHRAVTEANGEAVSEYDFRYPGPKPATREAALVMLSDSVQASVKSIPQPNAQRIADMVSEIIQNRLEDGQLDDCPITRRDLRIVSEVFLRILTGLYSYTRIEYPDIKDKKNGERTQARANTNQQTSPEASESESNMSGS